MKSISRGNAAEAAVLSRFVSAGFDVLIPFGGGLAFDLAVVIPPDATFLRVQVKSGRVRRGCVQFNTCTTDHGKGRRSYSGRADVIAVHAQEVEDVLIVPVDECPPYAGILRLEPAQNNQRRGVRFASRYRFDAWAGAVLASASQNEEADVQR